MHSTKYGIAAFGLLSWLMVLPPTVSADPEEVELDRVALAAMLVKDQHYDRAAAVLAEVDPKDGAVDLPRYYMLYGLIALKQGDFSKAEQRFEASVNAGQTDKVIYVFLAQAHFGLANYREALAALKAAKEAALQIKGTFMLRVHSHWRLGDKVAAFRALNRGLRVFPADLALRQNKVLLLVDLELYQHAVEEGKVFLESSETTLEHHLAIAEALLRAHEYERAILILEETRLRYPIEERVIVQLARVYLAAGRTLTAARLFEKASWIHPKYNLDAAELYRRTGRYTWAFHLNAKVTDQREKIRQRLGLLIDLQRFEEAVALTSRLSRLGLLTEEPVRYAVAFALFKVGRFEEAEVNLAKISDAQLFEKATKLRRVMGLCREARWAECQ